MKPQENGFFQQVYAVVQKIPYGRVTSYGAIAQYLGSKKAARTVGWALNSKKYNLQELPAHRVVNRNGFLTGKQAFGSHNTMCELLAGEGIQIKNDKILNFKEVFWDPSKELPLY